MLYRLFFILFSFSCISVFAQTQPNIIVLIADDMGTDVFAPYGIGSDFPSTPNLEDIMNDGLLFEQAYAYPTCAPSRASMLSGRYGNKNGLAQGGGNGFSLNEVTLFEYVNDITQGEYTNAFFGKWHLGEGPAGPNLQGAMHYDGTYSNVSDYYNWQRTKNGAVDTISEYVTSYITNEAINWLDTVSQPFLLWMAYNAPHGPFHLPPDSLYTRTQTNNNNDQYLCMIESVDHEVGRLYDSMNQVQKDNTLIIFLGDNGTPNSKLQGYPNGHGKSTLYEGGIRVPMFMSGYGVNRVGESEDGLVAAVDIFATIGDLLGADLPGGYQNSFSLMDVLSDANAQTRPYNYSEVGNPNNILNSARAIRNEQYKLIIPNNSSGNSYEFYDLIADPLEFQDLYAEGLDPDQQMVFDELHAEADTIFNSWSCFDLIQNGNETSTTCIMEDPGACESYNFEEAPEGLQSIQENGYTQLRWDHYSDATHGCLLNGGAIESPDINSPFIQSAGSVLVQGTQVDGLPNGFDYSANLGPSASYTLFNPITYPSGATANLIPDAHYKWRVQCGCIIDLTLPFPDRLAPSNVHLSPWSDYSVFTNLGID